MSKWNYDRLILPHENEITKQRFEEQQSELKRVLNDKEPSNKKPTYELVDGEPVCNSFECDFFEEILNNQGVETGLFECVGGDKPRLCRIGIPCIPGLREQRDELKKEIEQLKEERARLKPFEVCFICGGFGVVSQFDACIGGHFETCPACNGRREERESNLEKQGFEKHKHEIYTGQAIGGSND